MLGTSVDAIFSLNKQDLLSSTIMESRVNNNSRCPRISYDMVSSVSDGTSAIIQQ